MNESYYNTAKDYPELLELNGQYLDLVNAYETAIEVSGKVNDSLYNTCISMFNILSRSGIKPARDIWECLINNFANAALRETDIRVILQKQHILYDSKPSNHWMKMNNHIAFFPNVTAIWLFWRLVTETIKWQWIMQKKTYNINAKLTMI